MRGAPSILIVEDEPALAASMGDYLLARGYLVDHAADGHTGLRMALNGRYDAVCSIWACPAWTAWKCAGACANRATAFRF